MSDPLSELERTQAESFFSSFKTPELGQGNPQHDDLPEESDSLIVHKSTSSKEGTVHPVTGRVQAF